MARHPGRVTEADLDASALTTAVRAFTTRTEAAEPPNDGRSDARPGQEVQREYPSEALVFDCETLPTPAQPLHILVWRFYRDRPEADPATTCIEEGIAYLDDLPNSAPADYQLLLDYIATREADVAPGFAVRVQLEPLSWWLDKRLFRYGFAHADRCDIVGFNLLFDLGRLASYWGPAQGDFRGGFSLGIWGTYTSEGKWKDTKHRQRLRVRAIDPRRTLFRWGHRTQNDPERRGPGRFVDLRTLAFALTDRSYTLEGACQAFGDPYEKAEVEFERLTPELIDYAREDVEHTAILYGNCLAELRRHPGVRLEAHRLYSPASVGARYLEAMGLRRPLVKFTALSEDELGWRVPVDAQRLRPTSRGAISSQGCSASR
jgi:hypothetical protein